MEPVPPLPLLEPWDAKMNTTPGPAFWYICLGVYARDGVTKKYPASRLKINRRHAAVLVLINIFLLDIKTG
jgi:hypothetical protein